MSMGILGIDPTVRNGFQSVHAVFEVDADADAATLNSLLAQSNARSAVLDVITAGTAVTVEVATAESRREAA